LLPRRALDLLHQLLARLRGGHARDPLQRRALSRDGGLHLALPLAERGLALLQAGVAGLLLALLLAQELESTLEVAVLLAQALLGALEILPFLAGLLLE